MRGFAIANYNNQLVYITGGSLDDHRGIADAVSATAIYSIAANAWKDCKPLNRARYNHGSCALDSRIYVFAGKSAFNDYECSVETLRAGFDIVGGGFKACEENWQLIMVD